MKRLYLSIISVLISLSVLAQQDGLRVAVFDPTSSGTSIDEGSKIAIREIISSAFVNTDKYNIVERSMLEKVMEEQSFTHSGAVDDTQVAEIGKLAGANKVVLSVVTKFDNKCMLSVKMIDVQTAMVERQKVKVTESDKLLMATNDITLDLINNTSTTTVSSDLSLADNTSKTQTTPQTVTPATLSPTAKPAVKESRLTFVCQGMAVKGKHMDDLIIVTLNGHPLCSGTAGRGFRAEAEMPEYGKCTLRVQKSEIEIDYEHYNYFIIELYKKGMIYCARLAHSKLTD